MHNYRLDRQTSLSDRLAQIRPLQQPGNPSRNQTTTSECHTKPVHPAGPAPDQTRQIRPTLPPHQTARSDRSTRPQATILNYSASIRHSTSNLLKWYRSGAFFVGWARRVCRALDEPCKAYFPHTFGLKFPDFFSA